MRVESKELGLATGPGSEPRRPPEPRQKVSPADERAARLVVGLLYSPMPWLMRLLAAVHFRRLRVRGAPRFPARGPAVVVANHPATWTDVIVLEVALGRKLHFLAQESLFRPRFRGWVLRLFGSLPVTNEGPEHEERNEASLRRCRALLARGEVVAIFAEGVSADDRSLRPFRRGAARIALEWIASDGELAIVPVGIHYADRVAFREDVVVSVGKLVRLDARDTPKAAEREEWIDALTSRLRQKVESLIVCLPESTRSIVEELAPFLAARHGVDPARFHRSRSLARRIEHLSARPETLAALKQRAEAVRAWRARQRLHLRDLGDRPRRGRALASLLALGAPLALAGLLLHAVPAVATRLYAMRHPDPTHVALARIVSGLLYFPLWYAGLVLVCVWAGWPAWITLGVMFSVVMLGAFALVWLDTWDALRGGRALARDPISRWLSSPAGGEEP